MAKNVSAHEMGGATAGGQIALITGALVAPPAFGYLADSFGYRASWLFLSAGSVIAGVLLLRVIRADPPVVRSATAIE